MGPRACQHYSQEKCTDESVCARCSRLKSFSQTSRRNKRMKHRFIMQNLSPGEKSPYNMQSEQRCSSESSDDHSHASSSLGRRSESRSLSIATEKTLTPESTASMILSPERPLVPSVTLQTTSDALRTVMDVEQFSVIHLPFMLGSSFIPDSQKTIYVILRLSAPTLTEGYLAFLGLMTTYQKSLVLRRSEPDMVKAAKGLQRLRGIKIQHDYDAACALFLGQTMYVFNVLTAPYSNTAHAIVRSALMSTKRWLPRLIEAPIMDTITMSPIIIDTVECIFHREIPIIRLHPQRRIIVDRYVGLCATLLSHFYDICECSHALKTTTFESGSESLAAIWERLDDIEEDIRRWKAQTHHSCSKTGLLVIHRLRYPLGVEDEQAQKFANNIFAELAFFAKSAAKEASALPVVFPLTVAMFEVEGPGEDLLDRLASFTVQSTSAARLQNFVRIVRHSKFSGFTGVWFDLVDTHLHVAAPP